MRCITIRTISYHCMENRKYRINHLAWVPRPVCIPWLLEHCSIRWQQYWCSQQTPSKFVLHYFPLTQTERKRDLLCIFKYSHAFVYNPVTTHASIFVLLASILVTCLDFGSGDWSLGVSKDGVDGDGVLRTWVEALDHVKVKVVPKVYVLYVAVWKTQRGTEKLNSWIPQKKDVV